MEELEWNLQFWPNKYINDNKHKCVTPMEHYGNITSQSPDVVEQQIGSITVQLTNLQRWCEAVRKVSNILWNQRHEELRQREELPSVSVVFLIKCSVSMLPVLSLKHCTKLYRSYCPVCIYLFYLCTVVKQIDQLYFILVGLRQYREKNNLRSSSLNLWSRVTSTSNVCFKNTCSLHLHKKQ